MLIIITMVEKKEYEDFIIDFKPQGDCRKDFRVKTIQAFLNEKEGYWKKHVKVVTRYKYFVEKLADDRQIFLLRPTYLNKGIDFQVWVERFKDGVDERPSHADIINDLKIKKEENPEKFIELFEAIQRVWNCEDADKVLTGYTFSFKKGFSVELILKVLKWLFIEQDITYWNYDGRGMLFRAIKREVADS